MKWSVILFFLIFAESANGQDTYFEWVNPKTTLRERIDINTKNHLKEAKTGIWEVAAQLSINPTIFKDLPPNLKKYFYLDNGKNIWFTVNGTGMVYQFTPATHTFMRIDNTFYKGHNFFALQFVRQNKLYSLGGYGFWTYNKNLTYFDVNSKEWEIIRTKNVGHEVTNRGYHGYSAKKDLIYSGASSIALPENNMLEVFDDRLFVFDFNKSTWTVLGHINADLPFKTNFDVYWDGEHFIQFARDKLYLINPIANTVHLVDDKAQMFSADDVKTKYFKLGDTIYNYHDNGINIFKFSKNEMLKKAKYFGPFYSQENHYISFLIGFLILIIGSIAVFFYVKSIKRFTKSFDGIFEDLELQLINSLIDLGEHDYLTNNDINDILDINDKGQENQRKIKMNLINQINNKIANKFNIEEAICRKNILDDKRLKAYYMKPEVVALFKRQ
jgi:hypothetical protein